MSKLMFDDIRAAKALGSRKNVTLLKSKKHSYSPFSEFDEGQSCQDESYHLGDCPNLRSDLDSIKSDYIRLATFSVVDPGNGKHPFIVFFIVKDDEGKWTFPVTRARRKINCLLNPDLLNLFHSSYSRVGFFDDVRYRLPYVVYEVETINTKDGMCGNSLSRGMWVTANELLSESILGCNVCGSVTRFISETGQGISRLYKNGMFIPAPQVYYTHDNTVRSDGANRVVVVGDLAYAIVKTFFITGQNDQSDVSNVVLNATEKSGKITRVAVWSDDSVRDNYELESVVTGQRYSYCVLRAQESSCCVLSSHLGSLTTDSLDASEVLRRKMFIF